MDAKAATGAARYLAKLFPNQLTPELASYAKKKFAEFDEAPARAAIHGHRDKHDFINWPELWKACQTTAPPAGAAKPAIPDQTLANVIRGLDPQLRPVTSDLEVLLRNFRKQWVHCRQQECYKSSILTRCIYAVWGYVLDGERVGREQAESWAETIFWDAHDFQLMLDDLRRRRCELPNDPPAPQRMMPPRLKALPGPTPSSFDQLADLARHERAAAETAGAV